MFAGHEVRACNKARFWVAVVGTMTNALVREAVSAPAANIINITERIKNPTSPSRRA